MTKHSGLDRSEAPYCSRERIKVDYRECSGTEGEQSDASQDRGHKGRLGRRDRPPAGPQHAAQRRTRSATGAVASKEATANSVRVASQHRSGNQALPAVTQEAGEGDVTSPEKVPAKRAGQVIAKQDPSQKRGKMSNKELAKLASSEDDDSQGEEPQAAHAANPTRQAPAARVAAALAAQKQQSSSMLAEDKEDKEQGNAGNQPPVGAEQDGGSGTPDADSPSVPTPSDSQDVDFEGTDEEGEEDGEGEADDMDWDGEGEVAARATRRNTRVAAATKPAACSSRPQRTAALQGRKRAQQNMDDEDVDTLLKSSSGSDDGQRQPKRPQRARQAPAKRIRAPCSDDADPTESGSAAAEDDDNNDESDEDFELVGTRRPPRKAKRVGEAAPVRAGLRSSTVVQRGGAKRKLSDHSSSDSDEDRMPSADRNSSEASKEERSGSPESGTDQGIREPSHAGAAKGSKQRAPAVPKKLPPLREVEKVLQYNAADQKVLVKFRGWSYRKVVWVSKEPLMVVRGQLLRNFLSKQERVEIEDDWVTAEKVIARQALKRRFAPKAVKRGRSSSAGGTEDDEPREQYEYLVKWLGLEYSDCTWEHEDDLHAEQDLIANFLRFDSPPAAVPAQQAREKSQALRRFPQLDSQMPEFKNGRQLRNYQQTAVRWMVNNYLLQQSCILGDEMGLGKTAQSVSVMQALREGGVRGPFLIVAPLTTLGHWQREIRTWTDMNVVQYSGSAADRDMIQQYEFFYSGPVRKGGGKVKFDVLLCSYETLLREQNMFCKFTFAAAIFDEAHKLKGINSSTRLAAKRLDVGWKLLLTGTPIQNNLGELWSILNMLDGDKFSSLDDFLEEYGGSPPTVQQVQALRDVLQSILLRRMKEDVENLPEKEEVIVWVQLTALQHQFYKAIYSREVGALLDGGAQKSLNGLRNLAMQLRKICCHPFLCDGLEQEFTLRNALAASAAAAGAEGPSSGAAAAGGLTEQELLVRSCGKMVLLHKLLPKLHSEGRKVLVFSQFTRVLDLLEDYLRLAKYPFERIDGKVQGRNRQAAIDRFTAGSLEQSFVFLLSTRAGGQGITLTAADTAIIYDSDWNPQNDLQAMARCHRIGQEKDVTVYRLVTKDTYEEHLFNTASKKYGLDEAVLGGSNSGGAESGEGAAVDPEADAARLAALLAHGAHGLLAANAAETIAVKDAGFQGENIEQILQGRTEKRTLGSRAGNTFSVARFDVVADDAFAVDVPQQQAKPPGKDFWEELMPEAVGEHRKQIELRKRGPIVDGPRKRKQVDYRDGAKTRENDSEYEPSEGSGGAGRGSGSMNGAAKPPKPAKRWISKEIKDLEEGLLQFGPDRWVNVRNFADGRLRFARSLQEVQEVGELVQAMMLAAPKLLAEANAKVPAQKAYEAPKPPPGVTWTPQEASQAGREAMRKHKKEHADLVLATQEAALKDHLLKLKPPEAALTVLTHGETLRRWIKHAAANVKALQDMRKLYELLQEAEDREERACQDAVRKQGHYVPANADGMPGSETKTTETDQGPGKENASEANSDQNQQPLAAAQNPAQQELDAATKAALWEQSAYNQLRMAVSGSMKSGQEPANVQWISKQYPVGHNLPAWWNRACDEALLRGAVLYGMRPPNQCADSVLKDENYGFTSRVVYDPTAVPEAGAVRMEQNEQGVPVRCVFVRTGHVASSHTWSARACDVAPPTPEQLQQWLSAPNHNGLVVEFVVDICVTMRLPPGLLTTKQAGSPSSLQAPVLEQCVEVLVKFKGYCADLFTWLPVKQVQSLPGWTDAYSLAMNRLSSIIQAETTADQQTAALALQAIRVASAVDSSPDAMEKASAALKMAHSNLRKVPPGPPRPAHLGMTQHNGRWVQALPRTHWDALVAHASSRLATVSRLVLDPPPVKPPTPVAGMHAPPAASKPAAGTTVTTKPVVVTVKAAAPKPAKAPLAITPTNGATAAPKAKAKAKVRPGPAPAADVTGPAGQDAGVKAAAAASKAEPAQKAAKSKTDAVKTVAAPAATPPASAAAAAAGAGKAKAHGQSKIDKFFKNQNNQHSALIVHQQRLQGKAAATNAQPAGAAAGSSSASAQQQGVPSAAQPAVEAVQADVKAAKPTVVAISGIEKAAQAAGTAAHATDTANQQAAASPARKPGAAQAPVPKAAVMSPTAALLRAAMSNGKAPESLSAKLATSSLQQDKPEVPEPAAARGAIGKSRSKSVREANTTQAAPVRAHKAEVIVLDDD